MRPWAKQRRHYYSDVERKAAAKEWNRVRVIMMQTERKINVIITRSGDKQKIWSKKKSYETGIMELAEEEKGRMKYENFTMYYKLEGRRFKSRIRWIFSILPTALWPWGRLSL
jgi:hypothetical protein